jgi:hypothetical protein|eukprot:6790797-Prymnesium_polylepis.1
MEATAAPDANGDALFQLKGARDGVGGPKLSALVLTTDMFAGEAMCGESAVDLMQMKQKELSAELAARKEPCAVHWPGFFPISSSINILSFT